VLVAESERDNVVPHQAIANDVAAFERAHSLTCRVVAGAEHGLSEERWQQAYTSLLVNRATEMVLGAREGGAAPGAHTRLRSSPRRGPPRSA
jgi:hypothetical protein